MSSLPGLDVSSRVRARDIQMAAVADVPRRVVMISGAIDAVDHDISASLSLPEPGRWQVIKSHTNLTDQIWMAMQVITDENTTLVNEPESADTSSMILSRQFAKSFMTPDLRRITFFDGEVRPGEAVLQMFSIECTTRTPSHTHSRFSPIATDSSEQTAERIEQMVADGMPQRPVIELIVPVTVIG
jgi:uncharacterized protein DUF6423